MSDIDLGTVGAGETARVALPAGIPAAGCTTSDPRFAIAGGQISFTALASDPEGAVTATLTAPGDVEHTLRATIAYSVTVTSSFDLGTVAPGAKITASGVTVDNRSGEEVALTVSGAGYSIPGATTVPAASGPVLVSIDFEQGAAGTYTGSLEATDGTRTATCALTVVVSEDAAVSSTEVSASDSDGDGSISSDETKTTYKVHVPSFGTKMHLGAAVTPFASLDGFGLRTTGKGLLYADGNVGVNSVSGDVRVQAQSSDGNIYTIAGASTVVASKSATSVLGRGGVLISTALGVTPAVSASEIPDKEGVADDSVIPVSIFTALDAAIAAASAGRAIKGSLWAKYTDDATTRQAAFGGVAALGALVATGLGVSSFQSGLGGAPVDLPGVTIFGTAGVLLGTPGFGGFYAAAGLVLGSLYPAVMGLDSEMLGINSAGLTSLAGDATVSAKDTATVEGTDIEVNAKTSITAEVDPSGVAATTSLKLEDATVTLIVGDFAVTISASGIAIGSDSGGAVDASQPSVFLDGENAYIKGPGALNDSSVLKVKNNQALLQGGTSHAAAGQLELKDDNAKLWAKSSYVQLDGAANEIKLNAATMKAKGSGELKLEGGMIKIG